MKKISVFFLTILVGIFLFSCEKTGTEKQESNVDFSLIGKMHNKGLETILRGFQDVGVNSSQNQMKADSYDSYVSIIKSNAISYVKEETDNDVEAVAIAKDLLDKFLDDDNPEYMEHKAIANSIYTPYIQGIRKTKTFDSKLKELNEIATDDDNNLQSLLSRLQQLEASVRNSSLSTDEKNALLAGISVAQNSYQYWYDKDSEWLKTLKGDSKKGKFSWKLVGRADIRGAVDGAVSVAIAASIAGPAGWAAAIAGIAGAAAGSSAAEAVGQLLE